LEQYKNLPKNLQTPALQKQLGMALEQEGTILSKVIKGAKGRGMLMLAMTALIGVPKVINYMNSKEKSDQEFNKLISELGWEALQMLVDIAPVTGFLSNYYSAISGQEIITKRDVSGTWQRAGNAFWGTVSLAGDAITFLAAAPTGGGSLLAEVAIKLGILAKKGSGPAIKLMAYMPKLEKIAAESGGALKFFEDVVKL